MAVKGRISQAEYAALSATVKESYLPDGDTYVLALDGDITTPEHAALIKRELDQLRAELKPIKESNRAARDQFDGKSPEEVEALIAKAATMVEPDGMSQEEFERVMAEKTAAHEAAIAALEKERNEKFAPMDAEIVRLRSEMSLRQIVTASGGNYDLLLPHIRRHTRFSAADPVHGDLTVEVLDPTGAVRLHADGSPVQVSDLLREWQTLSPSLSVAFADPIAARMARNANGNGTH